MKVLITSVSRNLIILLMIIVPACDTFGQVAGKRHHISINGTPSGFFLYNADDAESYVGLTVLPELEYSYDLNSVSRVYVSGLWTGVTNLTATQPLGTAQVKTTKTSDTNLAISAGFNFKISTDDNDESITIPMLNSFSIGIGYGNFYTGQDNLGDPVYKNGLMVILGFKVRGLSFNIGQKKGG